MRFLLIILCLQAQGQICETNFMCTNGDNRTVIIPCSSIDENNYYTSHHLEFGDGTDTTFIGIKNPLALCYQAIMHTYVQGVYLARLTTSFYDSTTNVLICTDTYQDTICSSVATYIKEINTPYKDKIYNLQGIELLEAPKSMMYIKSRKLYYELCNQ